MKQEHWVVYGLRLRDDDEYRYIGQTMYGIEHRLRGHIDDAARGITPLNKWIRKHAGEITADIIEECPNGDNAFIDFREQFWIATFRDQHRLGVKKKSMLNIMDGGKTQRTWVWTDEQRAKVSERVRGEGNPMYGRRGPDAPCYGRIGELHPMFGKHHSDETKARMSASTAGKPKSEATREKMKLANQKRAASGSMREDSQRAMHVRWHVNRSLVKPDCKFCNTK